MSYIPQKQTTFEGLRVLIPSIDQRLQNLSTLQVQHVYDWIVNIITEIRWCKSEVFSAKEIKLFVKRNYETLMKNAEKKICIEKSFRF